jgi:hypothetical protein
VANGSYSVQLSFDKHFYGRIQVFNHPCFIAPCIPSVMELLLNGHLSLYTRNCSIKITKRNKILIAFIKSGVVIYLVSNSKGKETRSNLISLDKIPVATVLLYELSE